MRFTSHTVKFTFFGEAWTGLLCCQGWTWISWTQDLRLLNSWDYSHESPCLALIHTLKLWNSVAFITFTWFCNHHWYRVLSQFHSQEKDYTYYQILISSSPSFCQPAVSFLSLWICLFCTFLYVLLFSWSIMCSVIY